MQNNKYSEVTTLSQIRTRCRILFTDNTSFLNPKKFSKIFWKKVHDAWYSYLKMDSKDNTISQK